jgi:signal transduction histidine kinase
MEDMTPAPLERGILTIFRLFLITQLTMILVNLHIHSSLGMIPGNPLFGSLVSMAGFAVLFSYLSMKTLQKALGYLYLPAALVFSAIFTLVTETLFLTRLLSAHLGSGAEVAWQMFLFLFIPLVLVGWQYGVGQVIAYCVFTTILDYGLNRWADPGFLAVEETFIRLLLIRFFSFIFTGCIISLIMQRLRQQRRALEDANAKLSQYAQAIEQLAVSRERNRMARELHDTLSHTLSGVAVHLEGVDALWTTNPTKSHEMLERSLIAVRDGLTETRKAIQSLRASPLVDLGLTKAIEELAREVSGRGGLQLSLELTDEIKGLPDDVEQCFYRISQEAMENVTRHAQAQSLTVRLMGDAVGLDLEITDDGVGFNHQPRETSKHFGIKGMQERAALIHGALDISRHPERGTRLSLHWQEQNKVTETHD